MNTNACLHKFKKNVYILNIFIYNIKYNNINIYIYIHVNKNIYTVYILCVFINVQNKNTQYTYIYYINKNLFSNKNCKATSRKNKMEIFAFTFMHLTHFYPK